MSRNRPEQPLRRLNPGVGIITAPILPLARHHGAAARYAPVIRGFAGMLGRCMHGAGRQVFFFRLPACHIIDPRGGRGLAALGVYFHAALPRSSGIHLELIRVRRRVGYSGTRSSEVAAMKNPIPMLFALTIVALLGIGGVMNNACKSSPHSWCAPPPPVRQGVARIQRGDKLISPAVSRVGSLSRP